MPSRIILRASLLGLLLGSTLPAQGPPRIAPGPLEVRVLSLDASHPSAGVLVRLGGRYASTMIDGRAVLDGVPAGSYTLRIRAPHFAAWEKALELIPGEREPVLVRLAPAPRVDWSGAVVLEDLGTPIRGARIHLMPIEVAASLQGPGLFLSDEKGVFQVHQLPAGKYRARVEYPGCRSARFEFEVARGMQPVRFALERISRAAALRVSVTDRTSGRAVHGAEVAIAEAWPTGVVARTSSSEQGLVVFEDLRLGLINRPDAEGQLSISHPQVQLRVSAPGHQPALAMVRLGEQAQVSVALDSTAPVTEQEPNDSRTTAGIIRLGKPVKLTTFSKGDQDFFTLELAHSASLRLSLACSGRTPMRVRLLDLDGEQLACTHYHQKGRYRAKAIVPAGRYFVHSCATSKESVSEEVMTLLVEGELAADTLEPNDRGSAGTLIRDGETRRGYIHPAGDVDVFRFHLPTYGQLRFHVAARPWRCYLQVKDRRGTQVASAWDYSGQEVVLSEALYAPGWYTLELNAMRDVSSLHPYALTMEFFPADGRGGDKRAGGSMRSIPLELGSLVQGTVLPARERDSYRLHIPSAGTLRVRAVSRTSMKLSARTLTGRGLASAWNYPGETAGMDWHAPGPATIAVDVEERLSEPFSPSPYTLRAFFEPCDEHEAAGRNENPDTATPIELLETLKGSLNPPGDRDIYRFMIDHPGCLSVAARGFTRTVIHLRDARGRSLGESWNYPKNSATLDVDVVPGEYQIEVRAQHDTEWHQGCYSVDFDLKRGDPRERVPLRNDPPRPLRAGEAQPMALEHAGDIDRYDLDLGEAGKYTLRLRSHIRTEIRLSDRLNAKMLLKTWMYPGDYAGSFTIDGPTRLRLALYAQQPRARSALMGHVLVDREARRIVAEEISVEVDPIRPVRVRFTRKPIPKLNSAVEVELDADGDGDVDCEIDPQDGAAWEYPREGTYVAIVRLKSLDGVTAFQHLWVEARGPLERRGIHLSALYPAPGRLVDRDEPCRVRAISYTGARVRRVEAAIDGRPVATAWSPPFELEIPWRRFANGRHELALRAVDARGEREEIRQPFSISPYFGLVPASGAMLTGNLARVSWWSSEFGPAVVRYRLQGESEWREARGQSGRRRLVALRDLEAGRVYEFQPLGAATPGPLRTLTRVKGLAFGREAYGANIRRDYDQRIGISVRNHAEHPMSVRLECGKPEGSRLLAGFVGQGSEGEPFELAPGEEREFHLGLSAQDVIREEHSFPIRIVSADGFSDEAEVRVRVELPEVKLVWQDLGPEAEGFGHRFALRNEGDTVTDLDVFGGTPDILITPNVRHDLFPRGKSLAITARPRLHDGFEKAGGAVVARAIGKESRAEVSFALEPGQKVFGVHIAPAESLLAARSLAGAFLDPSEARLDAPEDPRDTDGDGHPDRWRFPSAQSDAEWIGEDTTGDGEVDFLHADLGPDGVFDYSALKGEEGWEPTNLVEAWLEMNFKLPWPRNSYEKHDVDVVVNGQVVGELRDTIPEGNYRFRLPPRVLHFDAQGNPLPSRVEIRSRHLRGGHYVVNSDFRIKLRTTGANLWTVAPSREAAESAARETAGLGLDAPDYSVSSQELHLEPAGEKPPKKGDRIEVVVPLRNLGAAAAEELTVALRLAVPGRKGTELMRTVLRDPPLAGEVLLRLPWQAAPGSHTLKVVIDPDDECADLDRDNNIAMIPIQVAGEDEKPTLKLLAPAADEELAQPGFELRVEVEDDVGISKVEARIDRGLWQPLAPVDARGWSARGILQAGRHVIEVRATDHGAQSVAQRVKVHTTCAAPELVLEAPPDAGERRSVEVSLEGPSDLALLALRVGGGPWWRVKALAGAARVEVPLRFGDNLVEALAATAEGAVRIASKRVRCSLQPEEGEEPPGPPEGGGGGVLEIPGVGAVNLFRAQSTLAGLAPPDAAERELERLQARAAELAREVAAAGDSPHRGELAELYESIALKHCARDELGEAREQLSEALELDPQNAARWEKLGDLVMLLPEPLAPAMAIEHYERALSIDPQRQLCRRKLIGLLMSERRLIAARDQLEIAVRGRGGKPDGALAGHLAAVHIELEKIPAGIALCRELSESGGGAEFQVAQAVLLKAGGEKAAALVLLQGVTGNAAAGEDLITYAKSLIARYRSEEE